MEDELVRQTRTAMALRANETARVEGRRRARAGHPRTAVICMCSDYRLHVGAFGDVTIKINR